MKPHIWKKASKVTAALVAVFFGFNMLLTPASYAQVAFLPEAGTMVNLTPNFDPMLVKGIRLYPDNPFKFDFIVDKGDQDLNDQQIRNEGTKLISYFLASLTTPEKEMWVNLSPYEQSRIIPESFGQTEMGKELLAQDYMLKQIMATALYPERELGREFWQKVYAEASQKFGTINVPVNTFNKVWIVPKDAVVYENSRTNSVFVVQSSLKVMLEKDYLAANKHKAAEQFGMSSQAIADSTAGNSISNLSSQIIKEVVIPALEREVNHGKNFAALRQVYQSLILAAWYKKNLKDNVLSKAYVDRNKIMGVNVQDKNVSEKIYEQYLRAYRKGVYNYIKEETDPATNQVIPRKYFSGGFTVGDPAMWMKKPDAAEIRNFDAAMAGQISRFLRITAGAAALLGGMTLGLGSAQAANYGDFIGSVNAGKISVIQHNKTVAVTTQNFNSVSRSLHAGDQVVMGPSTHTVVQADGRGGLSGIVIAMLSSSNTSGSAAIAGAPVQHIAPATLALGTPARGGNLPGAAAATPAAEPITAPGGTTIPADRFSSDAFGLYNSPGSLQSSSQWPVFTAAFDAHNFSQANKLAAQMLGKASAPAANRTAFQPNTLRNTLKGMGSEPVTLTFTNSGHQSGAQIARLIGFRNQTGVHFDPNLVTPQTPSFTIHGAANVLAEMLGNVPNVPEQLSMASPAIARGTATAQPETASGVPQRAPIQNGAYVPGRFTGENKILASLKPTQEMVNKSTGGHGFVASPIQAVPQTSGVPATGTVSAVPTAGVSTGTVAQKRAPQEHILFQNKGSYYVSPNVLTHVPGVDSVLSPEWDNIFANNASWHALLELYPQYSIADDKVQTAMENALAKEIIRQMEEQKNIPRAQMKIKLPETLFYNVETGRRQTGWRGTRYEPVNHSQSLGTSFMPTYEGIFESRMDRLNTYQAAVKSTGTSNPAMSSPTGGIDLEKVNVNARKEGRGVVTAFSDPRILDMLNKAQGLAPVIYDVRPMTLPMMSSMLGVTG